MSQWSVCLCGDSCRLSHTSVSYINKFPQLKPVQTFTTHTSYIVRAVEELSCMKVDGMCVCCSDGDELKKSLSELADKNHHSHTKSISRISSGSNPFLDIAHDPNAAVYKTGFLARKIHADMDGKKSKI